MKDVIQIDDQWYVLATSSRADDRTRVLKEGESFGLFDRYGDIQHIGLGEQGLYHEGTRYLSCFELNINKRRPLLLHSTVREDNSLLTVDLTTPDLYADNELIIPKDTLHIFRAKLLWQGVHYEHLRIVNYRRHPIKLELDFSFDADYADIFEVRGVKRKQRGTALPVQHGEKSLVLGYQGLDGVKRQTRILFSQQPDAIEKTMVCFKLDLPPNGSQDLYLTVATESDEQQPSLISYDGAYRKSELAQRANEDKVCHIITSNEQFNDWINRSAADLQMLTTKTPYGEYPFAGVPWFSTPFGRDGIITALQYLWPNPELARGVLNFLAATQAEHENAVQDAEPGKILHETRKGEMATLGEIPFLLYYGTVDATPFFIVLAGAYYERTGDLNFIQSIWPNIQRALEWIDNYGDSDGDGFVEYAKRCENGLVQQGWKDSDDSIFHADGRPAQAPIALCEVQGYVYQAKLAAAKLSTLLGDNEHADELKAQAKTLKQNFNEAFWCDDIGTFAIALDGDKRPCRIRSSNTGHLLFSGIVEERHAIAVADTLLAESSFSGWGVRTLADTEVRYNPMSYHNGSIWPHDNAIIAMGLAQYGFKDQALRILTGLFDTSIKMDLHRLPELFCGFERLSGQGPTLYPVACSPQAWASGTVFYLLQACLGMRFSPDPPQLRFEHPQLPDYLERLELKNIQLGNGVVDLSCRRRGQDVAIHVTRKTGDVEIAVVM